MATSDLHYETAGQGRPVVLLHSGFADSRIWDPQWPTYGERFRVLRADLRGFGRSRINSLPVTYAQDVAALLDDLQIRRAALVGCSLGGRVALELAVARPDLVRALVLVAAATPEALASAPEVRTWARELMGALGKRDLDAAVEVNLRAWVDGPHRTPDQVDPDVRAKIATMQRDAFINTRHFAASWREQPLVSGLEERLAEIAVPALVLIGALDMNFLHDQAQLIANTIPGARIATIEHTAHAPNIERPSAFDNLVVPFLEKTPTLDPG